jgi:hypothetical protein
VVTKDTLIQVEPISSRLFTYAGDDPEARLEHTVERDVLIDRYAGLIVQALADRGYRAELGPCIKPEGRFLILSGWVSQHHYHHPRDRLEAGIVRGPSKMFTHFELRDNVQGQVFTEFEIVAISASSERDYSDYLSEHMEDAASTLAVYLTSRRTLH